MDPNLLSLIVFGGIASASGATMIALRNVFFGVPQTAAPRRRPASRLSSAQCEQARSGVARFDVWFERTLQMSGLPISARTATLLLVLVGLGVGAAIFAWTQDLASFLVGALVGFACVMGYILFMKRRRMKQFDEYFPAALDLLARAVRAGESLDQAIELVAKSSPNPISQELNHCAKQLEMGLSVSMAMKALEQRVDLMDVRIFSNTISVHRETGGNLAITLERLAEVIRSRMEYHRQLRSVTSAGRFSAYLISSLGPILFAYLFLLQPEYGRGLWEDPMGRTMLIFAFVSQAIGMLWVSRLLKADY